MKNKRYDINNQEFATIKDIKRLTSISYDECFLILNNLIDKSKKLNLWVDEKNKIILMSLLEKSFKDKFEEYNLCIENNLSFFDGKEVMK